MSVTSELSDPSDLGIPGASPYIELDRDQWSALASSAPLPLTQADVEKLRGLGDPIDLAEVDAVYRPLTALLETYIASTRERARRTADFLGVAQPPTPFVVAVSGPLEQVSVRRADDPQADDEDVHGRHGAPVACRDCHAPRLDRRGFRAASRRPRPAPARGAQALRSSTRLMWWSASLCSTRVARPRVGAMFSRRLTRLTLSHTPFAAATAMSSGMAA